LILYKYWDWRAYEPGAVLPLVHTDREAIIHDIQQTAPSIPKIAEDLEQFVWAGMLGTLLHFFFFEYLR
jgi:hypothetical protein